MIYKDYQDFKLSNLGLGCMRLPLIEGTDTIDQEKVEEMVKYSFEKGINYFDTAWGYHNGNSELSIGKALKKYPRNSFYLASKFPGYDLSNFTKIEEIFEKQLEKCQVDYFDFYLFHNVNEKNIDMYLDDETYHTYTYLMKQKELGKIKHLGFSCHGTLDTMNRFLEKYGKDIEFCQIQLNYIDYDFQDAKLKVDRLNELNIPIWIMEPLRGGKLAKLPEEYSKMLKELRPEENDPFWAFRYLQNIKGVTMILSGISNLEQLKDNIKIFENDYDLTETELNTIKEIASSMVAKNTIPCTGCRYCTEYCPQGLDIPFLISLYNENKFAGGGFLAPMALSRLPKEKRPGACLGCGACTQVCPQGINIPEIMSEFAKQMEGNPMLG